MSALPRAAVRQAGRTVSFEYFLGTFSPFLAISTPLSCPSLAMQHSRAGMAEPEHICAAEASYESTFHQRFTRACCAGEMLFEKPECTNKQG